MFTNYKNIPWRISRDRQSLQKITNFVFGFPHITASNFGPDVNNFGLSASFLVSFPHRKFWGDTVIYSRTIDGRVYGQGGWVFP
jgi:hypothetical protein